MDTDNQKQPVQEAQTDSIDTAANQVVVEEEVARETVASAEPTSESDLSAQVIDSASELRSALTRISKRSGLSRLLVDLSLLWLVYALVHGVWLYAGGVAPTGDPQLFWKISASCFLAIGLIRTLFLIALRPNIQQVAERIEFEQKDLKAALLTAVGELKNTQPGSWVWLREKLFRETLLKSRGGAWESTGIAALFLTQLLHVWAFLVAALVFYVGYGKVMTAPDPGQLEIFPGMRK